MKPLFRIAFLLFLLNATLAQDSGFDLADALDDDKPKPTPAKPPKKPDDGVGLDLSDALGGDDPPTKPPVVVKPPKNGGGGGGGSFGDQDLFDVSGGNYEPEGGKSGGRAMDPGYDSNNAGDQPQDADFEWGHVLKMLNANLPEELYLWMKEKLAPVLENVLDLLNNLPGNGNDNQEL